MAAIMAKAEFKLNDSDLKMLTHETRMAWHQAGSRARP